MDFGIIDQKEAAELTEKSTPSQSQSSEEKSNFIGTSEGEDSDFDDDELRRAKALTSLKAGVSHGESKENRNEGRGEQEQEKNKKLASPPQLVSTNSGGPVKGNRGRGGSKRGSKKEAEEEELWDPEEEKELGNLSQKTREKLERLSLRRNFRLIADGIHAQYIRKLGGIRVLELTPRAPRKRASKKSGAAAAAAATN